MTTTPCSHRQQDSHDHHPLADAGYACHHGMDELGAGWALCKLRHAVPGVELWAEELDVRSAPSWVVVLSIGFVWWAGGTLVKHWWSHEAWGHAMLAGIPFGMLTLGAAGSMARTQALRARRRP
ncbi:hypothetical protein ABZ901_10900 [Actinacidiphila alni]|uniref:hypothetical protein n=1 Tax=Actinacidiphila alni TaxID=380248 RepID=UPI0033E8EFB7